MAFSASIPLMDAAMHVQQHGFEEEEEEGEKQVEPGQQGSNMEGNIEKDEAVRGNNEQMNNPSDENDKETDVINPSATTTTDRPPTPWSIPWLLLDHLAPSTSSSSNDVKQTGEKNPMVEKRNRNSGVKGDADDDHSSYSSRLTIAVEEEDFGTVEKKKKGNPMEGENVEMKTASPSTPTPTHVEDAPMWEEEKATAVEEEASTIITIPLLDYLLAYMECSMKELQVLLQALEPRRRIIAHLQSCQLRTTHFRPAERNLPLHAHDLSSQNANLAYACGGYLDITVRQFYFIKHQRKLRHPYLPCLIEFGGGQHASYYPLEVFVVQLKRAGPSSPFIFSSAKSPSISAINVAASTTNKHHSFCGCRHHCCCMALAHLRNLPAPAQ